MLKEALLNEIIDLREKKKIMEAELGLLEGDFHIFSKNEKHEIGHYVETDSDMKIFDALIEKIRTDEMAFKRISMEDACKGISENWNREMEGVVKSELQSIKLFERERIYD